MAFVPKEINLFFVFQSVSGSVRSLFLCCCSCWVVTDCWWHFIVNRFEYVWGILQKNILLNKDGLDEENNKNKKIFQKNKDFSEFFIDYCGVHWISWTAMYFALTYLKNHKYVKYEKMPDQDNLHENEMDPKVVIMVNNYTHIIMAQVGLQLKKLTRAHVSTTRMCSVLYVTCTVLYYTCWHCRFMFKTEASSYSHMHYAETHMKIVTFTFARRLFLNVECPAMRLHQKWRSNGSQ